MKISVRRHGALYDVLADGHKVGGSFHDRETATIVASWCRNALNEIT